MKVGDLVRYVYGVQPNEKELLGLVIEIHNWDHPASRKMQVQWLGGSVTAKSWHHDLVLEVINESR